MGLFVTISTWRPENGGAMEKRWDTILKGTAPKVVMDAMAKMKVVAQVVSPQSGFSLMLMEVSDATWMDGTLLCRYMQDVCSMVTSPVVSMEDWLKIKEKLPAEMIPK